MICWKIRIFAYWTTPAALAAPPRWSCDLLKNSYLCLLNNTLSQRRCFTHVVVICWKIRIFAYWTTPNITRTWEPHELWFAEKFVSLLIEQHLHVAVSRERFSCDLLKNSYLCLLNNTRIRFNAELLGLWFAEKFVSLLIEQHRDCGRSGSKSVVICWKIRIFAYWTTPRCCSSPHRDWLWFAEKFVSLLIEQHQKGKNVTCSNSCDLLKNSYLCLLNNT